jgi:hypothetical protein
MARPSDWHVLGLDTDPTPGIVESVQALAKEFGDFAHDVERAWNQLNSFGADTTALSWIGQSADAFKENFGPLPGRLRKLYVSYSEASDAFAAYWPRLQAAQSKADAALQQGRDAESDVTRATGTATSAAADLKTAQSGIDPKATADAQTAHDAAQKNLEAAKGRMASLAASANQAHDDLLTAARECAKALHHAQSDGIHNKHWWEHVGETLSDIGGKIAEYAGDVSMVLAAIAPVLDAIAIITGPIPGVDLITGALAILGTIATVGTAAKMVGDGMQGHWSDMGMDALNLAASRIGAKGGKGEVPGEGEVPPGAMAAHGGTPEGTPPPSTVPRTPEGGYDLSGGHNPVDTVPPGASSRTLKPDPNGGAQEGIEYKWKEPTGELDANGKPVLDENGDPASITYRLRVHSADGTAPAGSNAASGPTYRIQRGAQYQDESGNMYHRNVHNSASPHYDPTAANNTHVPWPSDYDLPWKK